MKIFLSLLSLLISFSCFSQDRKSLEERSIQMHDHMVSGNYDAIFDDMHPEMFSGISREEAVAAMKMETEEFKVERLKVPSNFEFGEIKKIEGTYYSLIKHDLATKITFKQAVNPDEREHYKSMFGAQKMEFIEKENALILYCRISVVAIADKTSNYKWAFGMPDFEIYKQLE